MNNFQKKVHKNTNKAIEGSFPGATQTTCRSYADFRKVVRAVLREEDLKPATILGKKKLSLYEKIWGSAIQYLG